MRENIGEEKLINNEIKINQNKNENIIDNSLINQISEVQNIMNKNSSTKYNKSFQPMKKVNKLHRYKIGIIFYVIYIALDIVELIVTILTKYDFDYNAFCETYIRHGAFFIFIIISPFLNKGNSSLFDIMNITKYYIPDWKKKKNGNLSSVFYVFEGTEEKFNKTVHKISFLFTILAYLAMSFYLHSYIEASQDIQAYVVPILFPMGSVLTIIFLRKFFLHTQNLDLLNIISIVLITISVAFFIVFQYFIFKDKKPFEIFGFSFIGGVSFGFFSTFLKYYSNIYGQNFRLTTILGYIGIFTITTIPFILCAICLFNTNLDKHFNLFSQGNNIAIYIILFITSFAKFYCCFHCIISLSPLVFSILLFFSLFLNNLINIFWGYIESGWSFYVAGVFLILGVTGGILDKYLKNTLKAKKRVDNFEIEERLNKQNNNDTFDDSYVKQI